MKYIIDTMLTMLVNGKTGDAFHLKRRIRRGEPVSPYIFHLCAEYLVRIFHFMSTVKTLKKG